MKTRTISDNFVWNKGENCQVYQTCPLDLFCAESYINLKRNLPREFSFPDRITISISDYRTISPIALNRNEIVINLITDFCNNILMINQVLTGANVLNILDDLLEKNDLYLQMSFSVKSEDSPSCSYIQADIVDAEGKIISQNKASIKLKLSEEKKNFMNCHFIMYQQIR